MSKLKLFHLITGLNTGGAEIMLHKLLSLMDRERFQNVVVSLGGVGPVGRKIKELGIRVHSLGMGAGRPPISSFRRLLSLMKHERPAIVQTWMYHADLLGLVSGKLVRVPHVVWNIRCTDYVLRGAPRSTAWTVKVCAKLSRGPSVVISNSVAGQAFHAAIGYHPRHWEVIPNGFDLDRFTPDIAAREAIRAELGICPDALLVGLVGRYNPLKDHKTFLRAARLLVKRHPKVHFLLAGRDVTSSNSELVQMVNTHELQGRAHLLGERLDVLRLMAALDIMASSSSSEGFPNVIGEAMACGVPCVVTNVGDSAAIVGDTGIVVPPRDPQALADACEHLIRAGAEGRSALGKVARRRIEQHYSLERIVRRYEDLYLSLRSA